VLDTVDALQKQSPGFTVAEFGFASANKELSDTLGQDFRKAEQLSVPITFLILLFAFGAFVAAGVPVLLAFTAVLGSIGLAGLISHISHASDSTNSVMLLMGMAVGVDYSLFYLKREREERLAGAGEEAIPRAAATSGQAVLISGGTVLIAMAGMLLAGSKIFTSIGVGTMIVVFSSMIGSLTVLPALLAKLGDRVERGVLAVTAAGVLRLLGPLRRRPAWLVRLRDRQTFLRRVKGDRTESRIWGRILRPVMRFPAISAALAVAALVVLALPVRGIHTKLLSFTDLPRDIPIVKTYIEIQKAFPGAQTPAQVILQAPDVRTPAVQAAIASLHTEEPRDRAQIAALYGELSRLTGSPGASPTGAREAPNDSGVAGRSGGNTMRAHPSQQAEMRWPLRIRGTRQAEPKKRAAAVGFLGGDRAAVRIRDLAHDREPETGAGQRPRVRGAVEAVEDVLAVLGRDARAVVAHDQIAVLEDHVDGRAFAAPLAGVLEQVPDRPLEPFRISLDDRRLDPGRPGELREARACSMHGVLDELVQVHRCPLLARIVAARELEQAGDQIAHLVRLPLEVGEETAARVRIEALLLLQHLDVRLHARQRRTQLVRGVGDESALCVERLLERREHCVERAAEPRQLVAAADRHALARFARLCDPFCRAGEAADGGRAPRATRAPRRPRPPQCLLRRRARGSGGAGSACARCRRVVARAGARARP